ncbi:MAG: DUF2294 domain-containing protein [Anaerolineales bacterium]|nr:DUF2294 domain-containing protein [Anaerolineales bacterium]MCK5635501.1 DUF2294 domain-containing protein [Anaerolineales bacterium]
MPTKKSRGEYEDEFTKAFIKFEKEQLGRGPDSARTYMLDDLILVRLRGLLTSAETALVRDREGQVLVKEVRRQLHEISRPLMETIVKETLGYDVISLHTDMSAKTGERIIVLVVDGSLDELFD